MWIQVLFRSIAPATAAAFLLLNLVGCGASDDLPRESVSGKVTLDGKPVASGLITFLPTGADQTTQGGGPIQDGAYSIPRDQGLVSGTYKVIITSSGGASGKQVDDTNQMPGMPPVPSKEAIPAQYNSKSTLTAEVKAGVENEFDFELTGSPKGK